MSDHIKQTIGTVQAAIAKLEDELAKKKELANHLAELGGMPPLYELTTMSAQASVGLGRDAFVGQALHGALRMYLEQRKRMNPTTGPATVNEMHQGLLDGGYEFETAVPENAKRSIRIILTKNSGVFYKLQSGAYGLVTWYGDKIQKKARKQQAAANGAAGEASSDEDEVDNDTESEAATE